MPPFEGARDVLRFLERDVFHRLVQFHRDVTNATIFAVREYEGPLLRVGAIVYDAVRKPKTRKREQRQAATAPGKKAMKQAKTVEQRHMKLQYKCDRTSNKSRRLPNRFTRR